MTEAVAFDDVARTLESAGSTVHAAEAHGCLCGALCVRKAYPVAEWLEEILPDETDAPAAEFQQLHRATIAALDEGVMEFQPLLPGDDAPLDARVEALGAWCQGYLYGFGAAGTANRARLPEDVSEVLGDVAQIAHAGSVGSDALEVEEGAYSELVEFLRVGVQLVFDELAALRSGQPASQAGH